MSRIIGLRDLYMCPLTTDDGLEPPTYGAAVKIPSVISMDIQDNVESVTFYSDDVAEQVIQAFSGKEVTIEVGYLTNEVEAKLTGNEYESATGVFYQSASTIAPEVALMFRAPKSKGDDFQYVVLYKGVLAREGSAYKTKEESTESSNIVLKGVFMPLAYNEKVAAKVDSEDCQKPEIITNWFTKPFVEDAAE